MRSRTCSASFFRPSRSSTFAKGDIRIVVVAVGFKSALGKRRGLFVPARGEKRAAKDVPGPFTVGLPFDGAPRQQCGFFVFLLRITEAGVGYQNLRQVRCKSRGTVAGGQPPLKPFRVLLANLIHAPAQVANAGVCQCEIRVKLDGLFEHL